MDRKYTGRINRFIEICFPPILVDNRFFAGLMNFLQGRKFAADSVNGNKNNIRFARPYDYTKAQQQFVLDHIVGESVLDIGCGKGLLLESLKA